jgi:hypothetical protein
MKPNPSPRRRHSCLSRALSFALLVSAAFFLHQARAESGARIWEESLTLPTYKVAPPDPDPRFYSGRTYQGAKATFYPYPVSDQITDRREDQTYKAIYLENPYIKISVLPELGGQDG